MTIIPFLKLFPFLFNTKQQETNNIFVLVLLTFCLVIQRIGLLTIPDAWPTAKTMQWDYLVIRKSILRFSAFHCLMKHKLSPIGLTCFVPALHRGVNQNPPENLLSFSSKYCCVRCCLDVVRTSLTRCLC